MIDPADMNPEQLRALRKDLALSQSELGDMLGFADPGRSVRAWECGERNGKPRAPSPTACRALRYLLAVRAALKTPGLPAQARKALLASLEEPLRTRLS